MNALIIEKKDIEAIKFLPSDERYEFVKNMATADIMFEGTQKEYVLFYTFDKNKVSHCNKPAAD